MLLLAAAAQAANGATNGAATALDRLKHIPLDFWWKLGIAVAALIILVILLRKLANMNKVVIGVVVFVGLVIFGFNWIYERNEPAWATPAVDFLAGFFPSKTSSGVRR